MGLFQRLLKFGRHCDVAVFLDGLNDCGKCWHDKDRGFFYDKLNKAMKSDQVEKQGLALYSWIPMVRLAYILRKRREADKGGTPPAPFDPHATDFVLKVYRENMRVARILAANTAARYALSGSPARSITTTRRCTADFRTSLRPMSS